MIAVTDYSRMSEDEIRREFEAAQQRALDEAAEIADATEKALKRTRQLREKGNTK